MANKGILGRKLGMTQVFDDENRVIPVTVIEAGPCRVVQLKTPERDGYAAVQLAFGETKPARLNKPELGHLKAAGGPPQQYLAELRVDDLSGFELGQVIAADVFAAGERVDVTGISKGSGFSRRDEAPQLLRPGRVARQPQEAPRARRDRRVRDARPRVQGHEDGRPVRQRAKVTTLNLEVVEGDAERGLLLIKGSVPGRRRPRVRPQRGEGRGGVA